MKFTDWNSRKIFHHTNIYGPAATAERAFFISWLYKFDTTGVEVWILMGDFNLIRSPENRSRPGGNVNEMMLFNDLIHHLDLVDIAFEGRAYSWSKMQDNPLLEKLDWVFTSSSWTLQYPDTTVLPLSRPISDHVPYVIKIGANFTKASGLKTSGLNLMTSSVQWIFIGTLLLIMVMQLKLWQPNSNKPGEVWRLGVKHCLSWIGTYLIVAGWLLF